MYAVVKENRSANRFFIKTRRGKFFCSAHFSLIFILILFATVPQISNKHDSFDNSIKKDAETLQAKDQYSWVFVFCLFFAFSLFFSSSFDSNALMQNLMKKRCQNQMSSQHEEMARYISTSWIGIKQELEQQQSTDCSTSETVNNASSTANSHSNKSSGRIHYLNSTSTPSEYSFTFDLLYFLHSLIRFRFFPRNSLENFVPFDLESFWRERILQNLIGSA